MIGPEDAQFTYCYDDYYKILPAINNWGYDSDRIRDGEKVSANFVYDSATNEQWMSPQKLSEWLSKNRDKLGRIRDTMQER